METLNLTQYPTLEITPKIVVNPTGVALQKSLNTPIPQASLENTINSLFPDQSEENKISKTRKHLGETAKTLSDAQVETIITEFQFLIDTWMDEYEKEVFNGLSLKEVLNGG